MWPRCLAGKVLPSCSDLPAYACGLRRVRPPRRGRGGEKAKILPYSGRILISHEYKPNFVLSVFQQTVMIISLVSILLSRSNERTFRIPTKSENAALSLGRVYHARVLPRAEYGRFRRNIHTLFTFPSPACAGKVVSSLWHCPVLLPYGREGGRYPLPRP